MQSGSYGTLRGFGVGGWAWRVGSGAERRESCLRRAALRDVGKVGEGLELLSMSECQGKQQRAWK